MICMNGEKQLRYDSNKNKGQELNMSSDEDAKEKCSFPVALLLTFAVWQKYSGETQKVTEDREAADIWTLQRGESSMDVFAHSQRSQIYPLQTQHFFKETQNMTSLFKDYD